MNHVVTTHTKRTGNFEVGLVISTYNRPYYLWKTLRCLKKTLHARNVVIVVVDDASKSRITLNLISRLARSNLAVTTIIKQEHEGCGIRDSLRTGWDFLLKNHSPRYLCNIDSDVLMKPGWLEKIQNLYICQRALLGPLLVTGFNADNHPVLEEREDYVIKETIGGLNMFFDVDFYQETIRPNLFFDAGNQPGWDWKVVHAIHKKGYPILCTRPSVLQHIGRYGFFSRPSHYDQASDY